jgi:large subunit ribosomal protein L18
MSQLRYRVARAVAKAAKVVGAVIAQRAKDKGIDSAVFDRNGNRYHGSIKEFAEAARDGGLVF